ncbi:MAG: YbaN family protein [Deltaproteobacteria bacterium]|nr:YbaN family protein [Deltaproteobacteria bacterium]
MMRILFLSLGFLFLGLGFVGIFLPLLPTTPFVLLAAFCFARSSPRFHQALLQSKLFGSLIKDWEQHGVIQLKAKCIASLLLIATFAFTLIKLNLSWPFQILILVPMILIFLFIWSRPSTHFSKS